MSARERSPVALLGVLYMIDSASIRLWAEHDHRQVRDPA